MTRADANMRGWATFDPSRVYRYSLLRRWAPGGRRVCFCLLNPSTADEFRLDPTLTRCLGYAKLWGFNSMEVVNIFALRSTDPAGLGKIEDPVGPGNDAAIRKAARRCELFMVGWGNHGSLLNRDARVSEILRPLITPMCLEITKAGQPKHPLYMKASAKPFEFNLET